MRVSRSAKANSSSPAQTKGRTRRHRRPSSHYRQRPGSTLVGHYSGRYRCFDGLVAATARRIFRTNPDHTAYLNLRSISLDIGDVELDYAHERARS